MQKTLEGDAIEADDAVRYEGRLQFSQSSSPVQGNYPGVLRESNQTYLPRYDGHVGKIGHEHEEEMPCL